jgi:hypothetical protein
MLNKTIYLYFKWKIHRAVLTEKWEPSLGLLSLFGVSSGISAVVAEIKHSFLSKIFLSFEQKDQLLKYCFEKIIYLDADKEIVKELIILFADSCVEYIASWLRKRLSILRMPIVKEAILSANNMNQYIFDLLQVNNSGSDEEEGESIPTIGSKNSVPIERVEEMLRLQAKGCPSKNKDEDDNKQNMGR